MLFYLRGERCCLRKVKIADREVFPIGFGTWGMGDDQNSYIKELKALKTGIELGIQVIDTAEMYGNGNSEALVGQAIQTYDRDELFLVSKVLPENASKQQLPLSLDASLKRLKTDYLDLYLLHWQGNIPIQETIEALEKAKEIGKIKAWGVSNFNTNDMKELLNLPSGTNCSSNQVRYNLGDRGIDFDLIPFMMKNEIPLMAYAPIARGDKLGTNLTKSKVLRELAQKYEVDVFQILLSWSVRNEQTIAIPQSSNIDHIVKNIRAANLQLSMEDLKKIDSFYPEPTTSEPLSLW